MSTRKLLTQAPLSILALANEPKVIANRSPLLPVSQAHTSDTAKAKSPPWPLSISSQVQIELTQKRGMRT